MEGYPVGKARVETNNRITLSLALMDNTVYTHTHTQIIANIIIAIKNVRLVTNEK